MKQEDLSPDARLIGTIEIPTHQWSVLWSLCPYATCECPHVVLIDENGDEVVRLSEHLCEFTWLLEQNDFFVAYSFHSEGILNLLLNTGCLEDIGTSPMSSQADYRVWRWVKSTDK